MLAIDIAVSSSKLPDQESYRRFVGGLFDHPSLTSRLRYVPLVGAIILPTNLGAGDGVNVELMSAVDRAGLQKGKFCPERPGKSCQEAGFLKRLGNAELLFSNQSRSLVFNS